MQILKLTPGMVVELKKPHPCGTRSFRILRVGSVCHVVCLSCKRDMDMDRVKLEKAIKKIVEEPSEASKSSQ
ncbi:MAG: DUF951 domain-containing protein [Clostridia bacterium]|nr:DUF951 domain-containing protein [Clostridia bacterium]